MRVREETKTGTRPVKPLLREWADLWQLDKVIYPERLQVDAEMSSAQLGDKISSHFAPKGWKPYNLRHAYARRCMEKGLRPDLAAKLMGHSLQIHLNCYRAWITESEYLAMVDEILNRDGN